MIKIENGIIESDLDITKNNYDEFISKLNDIKQINRYLNLSNLGLKELPDLSNIVIYGSFYCSYNELISLKGCPTKIGGYFTCSFNKLTSLIGCPDELKSKFSCVHNNLTSLKGCPKVVKGTVFLDKNVPLSKEILNIINNLTLDKSFLNKEDVLYYLREIKLNKILND